MGAQGRLVILPDIWVSSVPACQQQHLPAKAPNGIYKVQVDSLAYYETQYASLDMPTWVQWNTGQQQFPDLLNGTALLPGVYKLYHSVWVRLCQRHVILCVHSPCGVSGKHSWTVQCWQRVLLLTWLHVSERHRYSLRCSGMGSAKASFQPGIQGLPLGASLKRGMSLRELRLALSQVNWHVRDLFHLFRIPTHKHVPEIWQLILFQQY